MTPNGWRSVIILGKNRCREFTARVGPKLRCGRGPLGGGPRGAQEGWPREISSTNPPQADSDWGEWCLIFGRGCSGHQDSSSRGKIKDGVVQI